MFVTMWDFFVLVTWFVEMGIIFESAFQCPWFATCRSCRDQVGGNDT